jgi:dihydroflavonol-4-reductase
MPSDASTPAAAARASAEPVAGPPAGGPPESRPPEPDPSGPAPADAKAPDAKAPDAKAPDAGAPGDPDILVTGATGLVGSVLTRQLVAGGARVRILRRESSRLDLLGDAAGRVDHAVGELEDARSLLRAMEGIDQVYHTAAAVGPRTDRQTLRRVNVEGTGNVVNAALRAGIDRLVHTSSMAALGDGPPTGEPITEEAEWERAPRQSDYARSKHDAELEVHRGIAEGIDAVIVNPALVFGVGRAGENTRRIVDAVRRGWLPGVPPGGTSVVDVEDAAVGHRKAMMRGATGRRYFLGSENLSWREIVETIANAFGVEPPRRTLPRRLLTAGAALAESVAFVTRTRPVLPRSAARAAVETRRYSNERAKRELGCTFRPFAATARRIAAVLEG